MAHTIIALFADTPAAQQAVSALGAAGFPLTHAEEVVETGRRCRQAVIVEMEAREAEARAILLRAGAESLEERAAGTGKVPAAGTGMIPLAGQSKAPVEPGQGHERSRNEQHPHGGGWLREIVFGLNDGLVTTLVFIMAASAIAQTPTALLLVALSEITAGGVAMALGGYLAARTERDILAYRIATERHEIAHEPEEERAELRAIYQRKGLTGPLLERVVAHQTSDRERWLRALVHDELGVVEERKEAALRQGLQIGASFVLGGFIPAVPVLLALPAPWMQICAFGLTALTALGLGALKARYSLKGPVRNGLEFLAIVTAGTIAGAVIGAALHAV